MKKMISILMALGMMTMLLASCGGGGDETTGSLATIPTETTTVTPTGTVDGSTEATETTATTEATTTKRETILTDPDSVNNPDYGYYVRYMRNTDKEIVGVAVQAWKSTDPVADLVIDSVYNVRNNVSGELTPYPVLQVGIGQGLLSFQSELKSVTIPESVKTISKAAFTGCYNMETLNLSEGLTSIGEMAFWNCSSLKTLVIPSSVTEIGKNAFSDCTSLTSVTLPRAFESQVSTIFDGCTNVQFTYVD